MSANPVDMQPPQRLRIWTLRGRLGRVEYIVCSLGALVLAGLLLSLMSLVLMLSGGFGRMLLVIVAVLLLYGVLPILFAMLTVRRAHDFNTGGWIALLLLVPLLNMVFWFIPGTRDENRYGPAPRAPSTVMKALAVLLPVLLIGGFIASMPDGEDLRAPSAAQPLSPLKSYQP